MRSVLVGGFTRRAGSLGIAALFGALLATSATAQQLERQPLMWDGDRPDPRDLTQPAVSDFDLFGAADLAWIGTRGRGSMRHSFANDGPIDYYFVGSSSIVTELNTPTGSSQIFFAGGLYAGVPQSEWNKHRQAVPSLDNVAGGGWASNWNLSAWFLNLPNQWRPDDGQLGLVHSGASATDDGSCTDFTNDFVNTGSPLMASSDCAETWGSEQFAGASQLIEFTSWQDYFNQVGANNFTWEWWRVPPEFKSDELIGDWQTYGKIVDWAADNLARFGRVIPGGPDVDPEPQGWPLGLSLVFDAFTFANPDVANVTYWRALLINESEKVYGVPLDYDSLYFGNELGWLFGPQRVAPYFRPELGGVFTIENGANPNCNNALVPAGVSGCNFGAAGQAGFDRGAAAVIVLNSPLGDLRNKAFSDPDNPFYAPGHPLADDTITFNQGRLCGFGGCWANTTNRSARSGFGLHAAIAADVLDGRSETDFDALGSTTWWRTFRNYDYPNRTPQWNRWVPGGWDWNEDGVQDTLWLDTCLGPEFGAPGNGGCSELWSDTLPGRLNNRYANFGGFIGVGPFPLAAGDTTSWTLAIVTGGSRGTIEQNVRNAVSFYMGSYLGPEAATPPNIVSVAATPGDRGRTPGASVQLFFDDAPEQFEDVFLLLAASALETDPLTVDNPWLPDSVRAIARNNVAAIHIFKSCNAGRTFTADSDCDGDQAVDDRGNPVGLGWRPYVTFEPDENGQFPNFFVDQAVTPGKTYTYTIVTETRGFNVLVVARDDSGNPIADSLSLAPKLFNVLSVSTGDPNVVSVYVPASRQTGGRPAEVEFTLDDPQAPTEYYDVDVLITSDIDQSAQYSVVFGDSVVVRVEEDPVSGDAVSSTVSLFRTVVTSLDGGNTLTRIAYDSATYTTNNPSGVQAAGGVTTILGDTTTTVYADELTLVALDAAGQPLFASSGLDGSTTPGAFLGRADFPRWLLSVDNTQASSWQSTVWLEQVTADSAAELRAAGSPTLTWLQELATPTGESFNEYAFDFVDFEYGQGTTGTGLFTISLRDPERTNLEFQQSLAARKVGATTSNAADVAAALGVAEEDLAVVNLPFSVTHEDPNRSVIVAIKAADKLTEIPLGQDVDQVMVEVPQDQWVPGDQMTFLERIQTFQRATGVAGEYVVTQNGQPVVVDTLLVTWSTAVLGCVDRLTCNPVAAGGRGADLNAHLPVDPGGASGIGRQFLRVRYLDSLTPETQYAFTITETVRGNMVTEVTGEDLNEIRVVPNPYIVFSNYEQDNSQRRLLFTGLPPEGKIEIFTVSGQFVQRISYDESDLAGNGDLFWNMRTRENTDIASGLYVFVVTGKLPATGEQVRKLGKFVVIR
jgi:hypothetical protein